MSNVKKKIKKSPKKVAIARKASTSRKVAPSDPSPAAPTTLPASSAGAHALPSGIAHLRWTLQALWTYRGFVLAFTALYALLSLVLVHNFASDVSTLKGQLSTVLGGNKPLTAISTYALLVTTTSNTSGASAAYQYVLMLLFSLAFIWALRQLLSGVNQTSVTVKESFYESMYPLIPFVTILVVMSLELLPLILGGSLLGLILSNGIAVTLIEKIIWFTVFFGFAGISLWLLTMTLFSLYIVTLPGGRPIQSLKASRQITAGRRLNIIRKLLLLIVTIIVGGAIILVPFIILLTPLTSLILFILGALALPFVHTYLYGLYRELLV